MAAKCETVEPGNDKFSCNVIRNLGDTMRYKEFVGVSLLSVKFMEFVNCAIRKLSIP